jgi:ABC-type sugar transport system ATPase subunit
MSNISLRHIHKAYQKKVLVIKDASLEIFDGEFLVFLGPSGSGKTTMLRMIAGLEEINEGELWINGTYQNDQDPSTRQLSFVFQNYALLPHLTVEQNISFGLLNQTLTKVEQKERVEEVARILHLVNKLGSYPDQLSGGQRQRVALARALVDQARLILFDEPLSNLDALLRAGMRAELSRLQKDMKITSIYVTHDQTEAMALADRLVLMKDGEIIQVGTPMQMYHDPISLDVIQFIGSPEINLFNVSYQNETLYIGSYAIDIPDSTLHVIKQSTRVPHYLAIRPQDVIITDEGDGIKGRYVYSEHLGSKKLVHVDVDGTPVRVLVNHDVVIDEVCYLHMKGTIYLFDQNRRNMQSAVAACIKTNIIPDHPIVQELINYGYTFEIDHNHPDVIFSEQDDHVILKQARTQMHLSHRYDLLTYYPFIK